MTSVVLVVGGGGLAVGGVVAASLWWENALRAGLAQATGGEVDIERVRLTWSGLVVRGVVVTANDGKPCLQVERVDVGVSDLSLFQGEDWRLSSLTLTGVVADLRRTDTGWALPTTTLDTLHVTGAGALPMLHVPSVMVRDATFTSTTPDGVPLVAVLERATGSTLAIEHDDAGATLIFGAATGSGLQVSVGDRIQGRATRVTSSGSGGAWSFTSTPILEDLVVEGLDTTAPDGRLTAGRVQVSRPRWEDGLHLEEAGATDVALAFGSQKVTADRVRTSGWSRVAFGTPLTVQSAAIETVTSNVRDVAGLGAAVRGLTSVPDLRKLPLQVRTTTIGTLSLGAALVGTEVALTGAGWSGTDLFAERIEADTLTAGSWTAGDLDVPSVRWTPNRPLRLGTVTARRATATLDPYAPYLGLDAAVFAAVPAGVTVGSLVLPGASITANAASRKVSATFGELRFGDVERAADGVGAKSMSASNGSGTVSAPSGSLGFTLGGATLNALALTARTTAGSGSLDGLALTEGGKRVGSVDRVLLGADGTATLKGVVAHTAIVAPHAVDVPPVAGDHVPRTLGGAMSGTPAWWGLDVQGLPWTLAKVDGSGTLLVTDKVVGDHAFTFALSSFRVGPRGSDAPIELHGEVAGGSFDAVGAATGDGRVQLQVNARSIDAREFESYATRLMETAGLGIGPGRILADLAVTLTPTTLGMSGQLRIRNLTLVVRDNKKVGAALLLAVRNGRFEVPEETVQVDVSCALSEPQCSPMDQLAKVVTARLVERVSRSVTGLRDRKP